MLIAQDAITQPSAGPFDRFDAFTLTHLITVLVCLAFFAGLGFLGHRLRQHHHEQTLRRIWFWMIVATQVASLVFHANPWRWTRSLPLHICDLAGLVAAAALLTNNRVLRVMLYYWGIGLSTQALFTPVLSEGPAHFGFWMFFAGHSVIIGAAVYDITAQRFRPRWRDFFTISGVTLAYGAVMIPLDYALHWNYGYVGVEPSLGTATILDVLGPWPLRLVWMFLIIESVYLFLTLIWRPWRPVPAESLEAPAQSAGA